MTETEKTDCENLIKEIKELHNKMDDDLFKLNDLMKKASNHKGLTVNGMGTINLIAGIWDLNCEGYGEDRKGYYEEGE